MLPAASAGSFGRPQVAYDTTDEQRSDTHPKRGVNSPCITDDRQEECTAAGPDAAYGNSQAHTGCAKLRREKLGGIGEFQDDGHGQYQRQSRQHGHSQSTGHGRPEDHDGQDSRRTIKRGEQIKTSGNLINDPCTDQHSCHGEDVIKNTGYMGITDIELFQDDGQEDADRKERNDLGSKKYPGNKSVVA